jgi:polysaccharide pyruvyl transferase WcaK-like protein
MKIVQFGLCYSPNLGDGVIADCLLAALWRRFPVAELIAVDLSGRDGFGAVTVRNRALVLRILAVLPGGLRRALVRRRLGALLDGVEARWAAALTGADLAVVGGGQILSDADLNFPLKIARAAGLAARAGVPVAVHAAGVSRNWSAEGAALFAALARADLRAVALRDAPSMEAFAAQADWGIAPVLARDPGLLARACYGDARVRTGRIGLGIAAPDLLGYHADAAVAGGSDPLALFEGVAQALLAGGARVALFTNGAEEDRAALADVAARPGLAAALADGRLAVTEAAETPAALAAQIAGFDAVVAHRLHACILGYAYGLPVVGLGWDRKVESFFASVAAPHWFEGRADATGAEIAQRVQAALAEGVDPATHARVLAECEAGIDAMLGAAGISAGA